MSTHTPLRLPDSMTRDDFGPYARGLREHFGLSQQDVSERLHIRHRYINAIENNAYDQMPGRAYAKGYVHTYAEFLGLDPEQAVEICFGPEAAREQARHFVPEPMKRGSGALPGQWRGVAVALVVAALGVLAIVQLGGEEEGATGTATVAEVPEELLADIRRRPMPSAANHPCLLAERPLGCLHAAPAWRQLVGWLEAPWVYLADAAYGDPLPPVKAKPAAKKEAPKPEPKKEPAPPADAKQDPAPGPAEDAKKPE